MDEMTTMLQRIRTLSVQAANGTNTSSDRTSIQAEVTALSQEITRIACRTTFGGKKVLSGYGTDESLLFDPNAKGKIRFQVGSNHDDLQTLDMNIYNNGRTGTVTKTTAGTGTTGGTTTTTTGTTNDAGETEAQFNTKATAAKTAYEAIEDGSGDADLPDGTKYTFDTSLTNKADK